MLAIVAFIVLLFVVLHVWSASFLDLDVLFACRTCILCCLSRAIRKIQNTLAMVLGTSMSLLPCRSTKRASFASTENVPSCMAVS